MLPQCLLLTFSDNVVCLLLVFRSWMLRVWLSTYLTAAAEPLCLFVFLWLLNGAAAATCWVIDWNRIVDGTRALLVVLGREPV